jgi:hypothetical protein
MFSNTGDVAFHFNDYAYDLNLVYIIGSWPSLESPVTAAEPPLGYPIPPR